MQDVQDVKPKDQLLDAPDFPRCHANPTYMD